MEDRDAEQRYIATFVRSIDHDSCNNKKFKIRCNRAHFFAVLRVNLMSFIHGKEPHTVCEGVLFSNDKLVTLISLNQA